MRRLALRLITALIAAPALYLIAGFVGAVLPGSHASIGGAPTERIGLVRGPIHYDLLLPLTPATRAAFAFAKGQGMPIDAPGAEWLILGWGADEFYTTTGTFAEMSAAKILRAALGDTAVIRLDVVGNADGVAAVTWVNVSTAQIKALQDVALAALTRDATGAPIAHATADWANGRLFYLASGSFHLGHTCNAWLGETLRAAGLPFGLWTPTPQAFAVSLWWNAA